jgi:hypothetical protein
MQAKDPLGRRATLQTRDYPLSSGRTTEAASILRSLAKEAITRVAETPRQAWISPRDQVS